MDLTGLIVTGGLAVVLVLGALLLRLQERRAPRGYLPTGETDFDRAVKRAKSREDLGRLQ